MDATVMSAPFNENFNRARPVDGVNVLLRNNDFGHTNEYRLYDLGIVPDENDEWNENRCLLDANLYNSRKLRRDGSESHDPPDRS